MYITPKMRFFIPIFPSHIDIEFLEEMLPYTKWVGFNIFDLMKNDLFKYIKKYGLRETYKINDDKKIFLTTTEMDEYLIEYYKESNKIGEFIEVSNNIDVDLIMGPDWFVYEEMSRYERSKNIMIASILNQRCLECDKIVPNIHGSTINEMINFIKPFKEQGIKFFVLPGREYFLNIGDRKHSRLQFFGFTSQLSRTENIDLLVTGLSSPRIHRYLSDVKGFASLGWLIQANNRRLIQNFSYKSIFDDKFKLNNNVTNNYLDIDDLADQNNDSLRAIYNLTKINQKINEPIELKQQIIGDYYG